MVEHRVLDLLVLMSFVLAPRMTNTLLLGGNRRYAVAHLVGLAAVVVASAMGSGAGAPVWALFCVAGFGLHLHRSRATVLSPAGAASCVPFAFSVISSVWFVAGTNDLQLLGYNRAWSFYAALHGSVLGWLFVGCVAHLALRPRARPLYLVACFGSLVLFLCVAFGIDGVPHLKRIGVVGFAVLVPGLIARFALDVRSRRGAPLWWALTSLAGVVVSMGIALANEFWIAFPRQIVGMPTMVLTHGVLNAVVVVPAFFFAVRAERSQEGIRSARSTTTG